MQEVLCPNPACGKKYRLKGEVPPTFTCTKCGQTMDLSAFAPPPAPAGPPTTRAARRSGAVRGTRSRREVDEDDEEDGERQRFRPPPKSNAALIWGSLGGLVVAIVLVIVLMGGKKDKAPAKGDPADGPPVASGTAPGLPTPGLPTPGVPGPTGTAPGGTRPAPTGTLPGPSVPGTPAGTEAPSGAPVRIGQVVLKVWDPPAELGVTADEKERIERAVDTAIHDTGRAVQEAQAALVALDRKAIFRLVSEFKHIQDKETFEKRQGLVNAMIVDRILRSIDGYMERTAKVRDRINPESSPDWATGVAKRWNAWLEKGAWKTPLKPWDPRVDEQDEAGDRPPARSGAGGGR